jgi:TetR/AcrR family transcriptional regulator, transcriptional repressor of aconitase
MYPGARKRVRRPQNNREHDPIPKVSQTHLDARRQQILVAAIACFSRDGLHPTSMQDIVRQSGLSAGALYTYFKSKDEMIEAIAAGRHERERDLIASAGREGNGADAVKVLVRSFSRILLDPDERQGRRLSIQLWAEALRNPRIMRTVRKGVDVPREMLTTMVRAAIAHGTLPKDIDPDAMARVMIALYQGFALQLALAPATELEPSIRTVEKMFAAMVSRPGGAR